MTMIRSNIFFSMLTLIELTHVRAFKPAIQHGFLIYYIFPHKKFVMSFVMVKVGIIIH